MSGVRDVEVWAIPLDQPPDVVDRLRAVLDRDEARRAAGDPAYAVAHAATREILAARLGRAARTLRRELGPHGKPRLAGAGKRLRWNLSTGDGWALLAVLCGEPGPADPAVGVDVQRTVPGAAALRLARRYYPEAEAVLVGAGGAARPGAAGRAGGVHTRLWTCKEAYVKAFGGRLVQGLGVLAPPPGPPARMRGPLGACWVTACPPPAPGHHAALALTGPLPPRPLPRRWHPAHGPWGAG